MVLKQLFTVRKGTDRTLWCISKWFLVAEFLPQKCSCIPSVTTTLSYTAHDWLEWWVDATASRNPPLHPPTLPPGCFCRSLCPRARGGSGAERYSSIRPTGGLLEEANHSSKSTVTHFTAPRGPSQLPPTYPDPPAQCTSAASSTGKLISCSFSQAVNYTCYTVLDKQKMVWVSPIHIYIYTDAELSAHV